MMCHLMTFEKFLARSRGPELRGGAPRGDPPKKCPDLIVHNFSETGLQKNYGNQNFIDISTKLNFLEIFEILKILNFFAVFKKNSSFLDILTQS